MRCAIMGGGAAGLASAYYLSANHEVVLFEKQDTLGGNVRTLGLNEPCPEEFSGLGIDNGVIEFMANKSPCLVSLLQELEVRTEEFAGGSTSFFSENGYSLHMPAAIRRMESPMARLPHYLRLAGALIRFSPSILRYLFNQNRSALGQIVGDDPISRWIKGLMVYGYSMQYSDIDGFPLELARDTLKRVTSGIQWMRMPGGAFSYMQKIIDTQQFQIRMGCKGIRVSRAEGKVQVTYAGEQQTFDQIVFATTPDEVLPMLVDPTPGEIANLSSWQENNAETLIHTDDSLYANWHPPELTEFDIFERAGGEDAGYNAYLNRLLGLPLNEGPQYFLAFNMEDVVRSEKVVHRYSHKTTFFSAESDTRHDLRLSSGENQTHYAGAYLYDGLHEGAIQSACAVVESIKRTT